MNFDVERFWIRLSEIMQLFIKPKVNFREQINDRRLIKEIGKLQSFIMLRSQHKKVVVTCAT